MVALDGPRFPLRLVDGPITLSTHAAVLDWLAEQLKRPGRRFGAGGHLGQKNLSGIRHDPNTQASYRVLPSGHSVI